MDVSALVERQNKQSEFVERRLASGNFKRRMFANMSDAPPDVARAAEQCVLAHEGLTAGEACVYMALHQKPKQRSGAP